jgi:hypothetical protein
MNRKGWRRTPGQSEAAAVFGALGLAPDVALTDDEVRMAWRRVAAATHPDRDDGGDPAAFAAAAAAYTVLRTRSGRGELLADSATPDPAAIRPAPHPRPGVWTLRWAASQPAALAWRVAHGRLWRLAARVIAALALCAAVLAVTGSRPAGPALVTGVLTWLTLTARRDLAPRPAEPHGQPRPNPAGTSTADPRRR